MEDPNPANTQPGRSVAPPDPIRICLVNMPFASPEAPSLALTQLKAVLEQTFPGQVAVELLYLNLDFIDWSDGLAGYQSMISGQGRLTGAADWFFRQAAFPDAEDNTEDYLARYYFEGDAETKRMRLFLQEKRPAVSEALTRLVVQYRLDKADIVGFTCLFFQTMASFAMARAIKDRNPAGITILGGSACEHEMGMEYARRVPQIDYVFSGPALVSLPRFVAGHLAGDRAACQGIDGVFTRDNLDQVHDRKQDDKGLAGVHIRGTDLGFESMLPLDYTPFLDRFEEVFPDRELMPMLLFETSRGCSWGEKSACTFCGLNGMAMAHRSMPANLALRQLDHLMTYRPRCTFFFAVDTLLPEIYCEDVFPRFGAPRDIAIMYEVRPTLTDEQLASLCRAGVLVIQPGIEALATSTLKHMRKGASAFSNLRFLKRCLNHPLQLEWNLLIGSPGEEDDVLETYLELLPRCHHLPPPGGTFPISFDRFSRYADHPEIYGLKLRSKDYYEYAFPFTPEAVSRMAYHFVDEQADSDRLHAWLDRLNELVQTWRSRKQGQDGLPPAQLFLFEKDHQTWIHDTRSGETSTYSVDPNDAKVLTFLNQTRSREQVATEFGTGAGNTVLTRLQDRGLLFEEGDRMLSLVASPPTG